MAPNNIRNAAMHHSASISSQPVGQTIVSCGLPSIHMLTATACAPWSGRFACLPNPPSIGQTTKNDGLLHGVTPCRPKACSTAPLLALLTASLLFSGCGKKGEEKETEAPTPVLVETAVRGAIDHMVAADAILYPINQANVTSKISAPVRRVLVNRGDHVRAGQLLVELESADLAASARESRSQYEQAQAAYRILTGATVQDDQTKAQADVEAARQALEAAKKVYESRVALVREGALAQKLADDAKVAMVQAQSQFDTAQRHLEGLNQVSRRQAILSAEAQVGAGKSHYENAALQVAYAEVHSPIGGVVADRPVYPGEMPAAGSPLVSIVDISQVVARANIPVKEAAAIRVGRPARIAGPDGDLAGKVTVVSPTVDPSTTTIEVWVQVPNPGERLKPGASVRVSIIAETIQNTIVIPAAALLNSDDGGVKVMVVTPDSVAHERKVSVGVRQGERVEILSGLQDGEHVVTSGGLGLDDKAKVTIQQPQTDEDEDEDEGGDADSGAKPDAAKGSPSKPSPSGAQGKK
jgi:multidrug efflux pump subunit AcrA (membrane-fusion protein)